MIPALIVAIHKSTDEEVRNLLHEDQISTAVELSLTETREKLIKEVLSGGITRKNLELLCPDGVLSAQDWHIILAEFQPTTTSYSMLVEFSGATAPLSSIPRVIAKLQGSELLKKLPVLESDEDVNTVLSANPDGHWGIAAYMGLQPNLKAKYYCFFANMKVYTGSSFWDLKPIAKASTIELNKDTIAPVMEVSRHLKLSPWVLYTSCYYLKKTDDAWSQLFVKLIGSYSNSVILDFWEKSCEAPFAMPKDEQELLEKALLSHEQSYKPKGFNHRVFAKYWEPSAVRTLLIRLGSHQILNTPQLYPDVKLEELNPQCICNECSNIANIEARSPKWREWLLATLPKLGPQDIPHRIFLQQPGVPLEYYLRSLRSLNSSNMSVLNREEKIALLKWLYANRRMVYCKVMLDNAWEIESYPENHPLPLHRLVMLNLEQFSVAIFKRYRVRRNRCYRRELLLVAYVYHNRKLIMQSCYRELTTKKLRFPAVFERLLVRANMQHLDTKCRILLEYGS